ncbi:uncharacterized protein N7443_004743 [Penicillium atrosanguineum]|uniref:uncharacterized protein n=1 Tax=Penicillium atrosanguineum TaxID=1132637 RepID=UPI0023A0C02D|nr:uncharacterized protein N7443_004743 [Penicillium atrosanguineum]KAJ5305083.1 hypothetical protein N7443_004743 [Penicillium atrosanguineum]
MDSGLRSSRPLASTIDIIDEAQGLSQLSHFHPESQAFASFRSTDSVDPHQPLQNATAQNAIALESNAQGTTEDGISLLQSDSSFRQPNHGGLAPDTAASTSFAGQLQGKLIPDPPDLEYWRDRLFHVDETITLSEEQLRCRFQTYFPHVDNVYSHRSTQRYKRRPFVSHYWDCRLKGRPPGTPKSDDPTKKKRKRTARERDLCDVKIKITEYFPGGGAIDTTGGFESLPAELLPGVHTLFPVQGNQPFGVLAPGSNLPLDHPGVNGARYFTIQRVNGNGANGKSEGVGGGHQHTLEDSDRVKKNSVHRHFMKHDKERKKSTYRAMDDTQMQKSYHTKATGLAAATAISHSVESNLKLFGSCFCPFVQRVWIALELKGIPYQYIEVDPYKKPQSLLEVNPRGLVPALRHDDWGCYESIVLMEYLEDLNLGTALMPADPKLRAHCRLWADHINRNIVPTFYRVLQEQDQQKQIAKAQELRNAFNQLMAAAHARGPFFMGPHISFVDVQAAPWVLRLSRVLKPYRGWPDAEEGTRWGTWVNALETNEHVRATTSTDELYLDSYERYAENRPNTSQVANAINSGHGLP